MLRTIISVYKTLFFIYCALALLGFFAFGLFVAIEGATPDDRWLGLAIMIGGFVLSVFMAGSLAIMLENNELLRIIANNTEPQQGNDRELKSERQTKEKPTLRKEPVIGRQ